MRSKTGVTRRVFLIGRWAIKIPRVRNGWGNFLRGILSNISETKFSCLSETHKLCPVLFALPGGWVIVQKCCNPLTDDEWATIEHMWEPGYSSWNGVSCDFKRENFGTFDGNILLLDYGELT